MMAASTARDAPLVQNEEHGLEVPKRAVYMVYLTVLMDTIGSSISTPVMPYYAKSFGVGPAGVGYLFGAWSLTASIFPPILGRLADRIGRKPVLVLSLVGAGSAAIAQGIAPNFYVLLAARAFSGIWGAVGSTAQVYIADVAPPAVCSHYLTMVTTIPLIGVVFGPGIGGLLSKVSLNFPVLLDGTITFVTAVGVAAVLVETPAFLRSRAASAAEQCNAGQAENAECSTASPTSATERLPGALHVLGFSTFFVGVVFGTIVSMYAVFMQAEYGLDALHVGLIYMVLGVAMVSTNVLLVKKAQQVLGLYKCAAVGGVICAVFLVLMAEVHSMPWSICFFLLGTVGHNVRMATNPSIVAEMTTTRNRGVMFGWIMRYTNFGRFIGPIVMGHLAELRADLPFVAAGFAAVLAMVLLFPVERMVSRTRDVPETQAASMQQQGDPEAGSQHRNDNGGDAS